MQSIAIHTPTQIHTKEKSINVKSNLYEMTKDYALSYHSNNITIQNWHGQCKMFSVPTLTAIKCANYTYFGTIDGKLLMYSHNGQLLVAFKAHFQSITAIEANKYYVVTGSSDGSVKVWYVDQLLSHSEICVDEFMMGLQVTQIRLWNNSFYISSLDKHLKVFKNTVKSDITLPDGIADFDVGVYGICMVLNNGSVGLLKKDNYTEITTIENPKFVLWNGQKIICASYSKVYELSQNGDVLSTKEKEAICGLKRIPMCKNLISKKELPIYSKSVEPLKRNLTIEIDFIKDHNFIDKIQAM